VVVPVARACASSRFGECFRSRVRALVARSSSTLARSSFRAFAAALACFSGSWKSLIAALRLLGFAETVEAEDGLAARRVTAC
jgi:CHASE1-domain containing sensor protein